MAEKNLSLEGDHFLLGDVVSNVASVKTLRKPSLAEEDSIDSGSVSGETCTVHIVIVIIIVLIIIILLTILIMMMMTLTSTGLLLDSGLSSSVRLKAGQSWHSDSLVRPDDRLLGCNHLKKYCLSF